MYKNRECDLQTKFNLLTKSFLFNKDIRELTGCSSATATSIIASIHIEIAKEGKKPNPRAVSPRRFCKHMGWDMQEIINMYKMVYLSDVLINKAQ